MKAFKFSLAKSALDWYVKLPARSITTWAQLEGVFTDKFFPAYKTKEGRKRIYDFEQGERETLGLAWERFKSIVHSCPTHGLPMFQLITAFFEGMNDSSRIRMNDYSNGQLIKMEPAEAWQMLDEVTGFDRTFGPRVPQKGGLYEIPKEIDRDVRAQFQQDEANRNRKLIQSLKGCQIC